MEKQVEIDGKSYTVRELTYLEGLEIEETRQKSGIKETAKKMLQLSAGITEEDMNTLSMKAGRKLQEVFNEVNEIDDFQKPTIEKN